MPELTPGTILLDKYAVEGLIIEGGTSPLYRGHPVQGTSPIAIRQLDTGVGTAGQDLEQFEKEVEILKGLDHPGLARAVDFFEHEGQWYLVEEFVPGATLDDRMHASKKLTLDETVDVIVQVLDVLEYLHEHGVVYRDLKPSNVILQPVPAPLRGRDVDPRTNPSMQCTARLVDFGSERRWKRGVTSDDVPLGTPGYAPPEQYGSAEIDARSDLYSAGVLLHSMLTGQTPDPARGRVMAPPHRVVPSLPRELSDIVIQAVDPRADRRFQNAANMRRAIKRAVGRMPACKRCGRDLPERGGECPRCPSAGPRSSGATMLLALALILLAVVVIILGRHSFTNRQQSGLTSCGNNLKSIGAALETYSTGVGGGHFPPRLENLEPGSLKEIPTCPSASTDTYSQGYSTASNPDVYTIVCAGTHHSRGANIPQYTSTRGLVTR